MRLLKSIFEWNTGQLALIFNEQNLPQPSWEQSAREFTEEEPDERSCVEATDGDDERSTFVHDDGDEVQFCNHETYMTDVLKWTATFILICGFGLFSSGVAIGWYLQIVGGILWLAAGIRMRDKPIIFTNSVMTIVGIIGKFLL